jgi:hypothetical protein
VVWRQRTPNHLLKVALLKVHNSNDIIHQVIQNGNLDPNLFVCSDLVPFSAGLFGSRAHSSSALPCSPGGSIVVDRHLLKILEFGGLPEGEEGPGLFACR